MFACRKFTKWKALGIILKNYRDDLKQESDICLGVIQNAN